MERTDTVVFLPARRRRRRLVPLVLTALAAALWLFVAAQPLNGTGLKFAALTLVLGIGGRYAYVKLSPSAGDLDIGSVWVFVLALAFALALQPIESFVTEPDLDSGGTLARSYGLVAPGQVVTAIDRCTARQLRSDGQTATSAPAGMADAARRDFYRRVCTRAQGESLLLVSGIVLDRNRFAQIEQEDLARRQAGRV